MDDSTPVNGNTLADIVLDQLNMTLAFIVRPVMQRQILAITVIIGVALVVPAGVRWWRQRQKPVDAAEPPAQGWQRWATRLYVLFTPLIGLALANGAMWLFDRQGYPNGLVASSRTFFWLWLIYRTVLMFLYARLGTSVRPYHRFVFIPIFLLVVLWQLLGRQLGIAIIATVPIFTFGRFTLTVGNLVSALVLLYIFLVGGWVIERVINHNLQNRLDAEPGKIRSLAALSRYAISGAGIVISLVALGLDATSIGLVAGGLSVGIGIGLQEIIGNFVSGLTLMFEQSLRPGDIIELNGQVSEVERVSLRTTTVRTFDNIRLIVPNSVFTTQPVTSLTKDVDIIRVLLPLRVAYDTDPEQVKAIVEQAALGHPQVLTEPPPLLFFRGVGVDSSLELELAVWSNQPKFRGLLRSELYYVLFAALTEHNIEIPVPRRELNLRQGAESNFGTKPT